MEQHKNIVIVEDNEPLNDAFVEIISTDTAFKVTGSYLNAEDALKQLKDDRPHVVIMDVDLPGMDGIQCTKEIKNMMPDVIIIMSTVYENSETVFNALCAGASGYLTKNTTPEKLLKALHEALNDGAPMSINIAKMVVESFQKATTSLLSERETEVLTLLSKGKSYQGIAEELFISKNTIKYHIKNIYDKLQVNSKDEAIKKAEKDRLI